MPRVNVIKEVKEEIFSIVGEFLAEEFANEIQTSLEDVTMEVLEARGLDKSIEAPIVRRAVYAGFFRALRNIQPPE